MPDTERMTLRRTNWPDIDDVAALAAATDAARVAGHSSSTAARVLSEEMPRLMADNGRVDQLGSWVARDRSTGRFLGWFTARPIGSPARAVELSYRLYPTPGSGYDVEGARHLIAMAREAQVATVIATADPDDVEFGRVMEQAGLSIISTAPDDPSDAAALEQCAGDYALDLRAG